MSKYTILGKYVFVWNDSMIAEFSNLMLIISEHDEKYIKKIETLRNETKCLFSHWK